MIIRYGVGLVLMIVAAMIVDVSWWRFLLASVLIWIAGDALRDGRECEEIEPPPTYPIRDPRLTGRDTFHP